MSKLFIFSRYWNQVAFFIIRIGQNMIYDYTYKNTDVLNFMDDEIEGVKEILCYIPKPTNKE